MQFLPTPPAHLASQLGVILFEFQQNIWQQKTRVPQLSCDVVNWHLSWSYSTLASFFDNNWSMSVTGCMPSRHPTNRVKSMTCIVGCSHNVSTLS